MSERRAIDKPISSIAERLAGLSEWPHRTSAFADFVARIAPEEASRLFDALLARAVATRARKIRIASFTARFSAVRGEWPEEHIVHTREAAVAQGDSLTDAVLFAPKTEELDDAAFAVPDYGGARPLTLGERRALAARPSRRAIELVVRDPDPRVALRLLGNPKLTENDVVRLAARRPFPGATLLEIALHVKWRERRKVSVALVQNPCTPVWMALSLLPDLPAQTIAEIVDDQNLAGALRNASRLLLAAAKELRRPSALAF
jgi:hypothetical protein